MRNSKKEISLDTIERGLKDSDWRVRAAAMNACQGRDVPLDTIERWLKDSDRDVRAAAMNVCQTNGLPVPIIRTIEPPDLVYKKCIGGIIVVASIAEDAQVRGGIGRKCRASKATIKDVIGDLFGEKVGISKYDAKTLYFEGDEVEIENFDFSDAECSTGFHFFCTREEAERYS